MPIVKHEKLVVVELETRGVNLRFDPWNSSETTAAIFHRENIKSMDLVSTFVLSVSTPVSILRMFLQMSLSLYTQAFYHTHTHTHTQIRSRVASLSRAPVSILIARKIVRRGFRDRYSPGTSHRVFAGGNNMLAT